MALLGHCVSFSLLNTERVCWARDGGEWEKESRASRSMADNPPDPQQLCFWLSPRLAVDTGTPKLSAYSMHAVPGIIPDFTPSVSYEWLTSWSWFPTENTVNYPSLRPLKELGLYTHRVTKLALKLHAMKLKQCSFSTIRLQTC
eukprot:1157492-Pelagomonas_calceolata.AAC.1